MLPANIAPTPNTEVSSTSIIASLFSVKISISLPKVLQAIKMAKTRYYICLYFRSLFMTTLVPSPLHLSCTWTRIIRMQYENMYMIMELSMQKTGQYKNWYTVEETTSISLNISRIGKNTLKKAIMLFSAMNCLVYLPTSFMSRAFFKKITETKPVIKNNTSLRARIME